MKNLILQLSSLDLSQAEITSYLLDETGKLESEQTDQLSKLTLPECAYNLIVMLPGQNITSQTISLPKVQRNQLQNAASFALEESLAEPIEKQHIALSKQQVNGDVDALIIKKTLMATLMDSFNAANLTPQIMLPDYLCLNWQADTISVGFVDDHVLIRSGQNTGCTFEENLIAAYLPTLLDDNPDTIINAYDLPENIKKQLPDIDRIHFHKSSATDLSITHLQSVINLLNGEFKSKKRLKTKQATKSSWRYALYAFVAWIVIWLGGNALAMITLKLRTNHLKTQISQIYFKQFPDMSSVVNPKMKMIEKIKSYNNATKQNLFSKLLGSVGSNLKATPNVHLTSLDFDSPTLTLNISANAISDLQQFTHSLETKLNVKQSQLKQADKNVTAVIEVRELV